MDVDISTEGKRPTCICETEKVKYSSVRTEWNLYVHVHVHVRVHVHVHVHVGQSTCTGTCKCTCTFVGSCLATENL